MAASSKAHAPDFLFVRERSRYPRRHAAHDRTGSAHGQAQRAGRDFLTRLIARHAAAWVLRALADEIEDLAPGEQRTGQRVIVQNGSTLNCPRRMLRLRRGRALTD